MKMIAGLTALGMRRSKLQELQCLIRKMMSLKNILLKKKIMVANEVSLIRKSDLVDHLQNLHSN